jgi:hypothetical protein
MLEGSVEGTLDGSLEGSVEGKLEGSLEGSLEGTLEGLVEGTLDGLFEGSVEGSLDGMLEGFMEGSLDGLLEGSLDGLLEGSMEGSFEGSLEGSLEGLLEGSMEGSLEGLLDGLLEGFLLGTLVGAAVVTNTNVVKVAVAVEAVSFNSKRKQTFMSLLLGGSSPAATDSWVSALRVLTKVPSATTLAICACALSSSVVVDVLSVGHSPGLHFSMRKIWNTTCRNWLVPNLFSVILTTLTSFKYSLEEKMGASKVCMVSKKTWVKLALTA